MVQTQPPQTPDFLFFLGKLLKNKRTEKICDFKSQWVLVKMKLLKTNPLYFSLVKEVFKMSAKRDKTTPMYVLNAGIGSHGDKLWDESSRDRPHSPRLHHTWSWLLVGLSTITVEWSPTSWLGIPTQHTQERQKDKAKMSADTLLTEKLLGELKWTSFQYKLAYITLIKQWDSQESKEVLKLT